MVFVAAHDGEPGCDLTSNLIFQRVAKFSWTVTFAPLSQIVVEALGCCIGEFVFYDKRSAAFSLIVVKEEEAGVHESRKQIATRPQHSGALLPNRVYVRHEYIGDRMEDQVKAAGRKFGEICHVPAHTFER
jgi:hypothetical protein